MAESNPSSKHDRNAVSGRCLRLTCRFGPGEDELGGAASLHLSVAGVNVNAVNGEGLQAGDLQLALRHRLLNELKVPLRGLRLYAAAVAGGLERRHSAAAVGEEPIPARVSGVGDVEEISAVAIRWPGSG